MAGQVVFAASYPSSYAIASQAEADESSVMKRLHREHASSLYLGDRGLVGVNLPLIEEVHRRGLGHARDSPSARDARVSLGELRDDGLKGRDGGRRALHEHSMSTMF